MPPFSTAAASAASLPAARPGHQIATLNVGGQLFQTTRHTLSLAGPKSILSSLSPSTPFIDRDPALFAVLLSLLRTGRLPSSSSASFDTSDLLAEAQFYGISHLLLAALSGPSRFDPFALRRSLTLPLHGRDPPSALAADLSGAVLAAHGGKVTLFDPSLRRRSTLLTRLPAIDSLLHLPGSTAAAGAVDFPGLQVLHLDRGSVVETLNWASHPSFSTAASTVQAIGSSPDLLFGSFESCRRNASAIVAFDLDTLRPSVEFGRQEVYGADLDSAIPATKLKWVSGFNLLMAAGSHSGPSGLMGNIRLWDVRSGETAWELKEKLDCFADVTVSDSLSAIFKVGVNSGEVFMADLRKLSKDESWTGIGGGERKAAGNVGRKEGSGCRIEGYGSQVFCSRGGEVEIWSEVAIGGSVARRMEDGLDRERVMRRNVMGRAKDAGGSKITQMAFGGNRMVLARKDEQVVEVWESSPRN